MRKGTPILLSLALICGFVLVPSPAGARMEPGLEEPPGVQLMSPVPPANLQMIPEEILAAFEGGMSAEEFVERTGHVPHALEGLVEGKEGAFVIELDQAPLAVYLAKQKAEGQVGIQAADKVSYIEDLKRVHRDFRSQLKALDDNITVISEYQAAYNGLLAYVPLGRLDEIGALPGVKAIHRAPEHKLSLSSSVPLIGAPQAWDLGWRGDGMTIAVIDSGIDYTHANFGGSGDPADYASNDPDVIEQGSFPTAKVVGGWDFAGTNYDASGNTGSTIPSPDPDPLDEMFHGTHVASIAAGMEAGEVMDGVAPEANLIALKVFGESGSTLLTMDAIDWATAHYIIHGYPEVINMSLGSLYGPADPDNPSIRATDNAVEAGIVVVGAAGNAGDTSYIVDSPGSADKAISVAASEDGLSVVDGFEVTTPEEYADVYPGLQSVYFDWMTTTLPITGTLVYPDDQRTGCYPFNEDNTQLIDGNIVLLDWTEPSCGGSVARTGNAVAAGAIGVLIADDSPGFDLYIAGSDVVPAYSIPYDVGVTLKAALLEGEVEVVMTAEYAGQIQFFEDTFVDAIATFSSRGPRGFDSYLKPDVTAPGGSIFAADIGTGTGGVSYGGTSMSSPHVAGVAALMKQAHPDWTPEEVKAAMMNTAVDLVTGFQIPRQGGGRIEAGRAITTPVVAIADEDLVSANWGLPVIGDDEAVMTKTITLRNWDVFAHDFDVTAALQTGTVTETASLTEAVTVEVSQDTVTVPAGDSATLGITLTVDATEFPFGFGELEEVYGFVTFGNQTADSHRLRVPFYVIPRPYSHLAVIDSNTSMANPAVGTVQATLQHSGPVSSSLSVYPALLYDDNEAAQMDPGDVRMLGMSYLGASPDYGDLVGVAINSYGPWHTPQPYFAEFDLYLDVDEDGVDDYLLFNYNYGSIAGGDPTDVWVVVQVELGTGSVFLASPYLIDTDFTANVMEWYLPAGWNGLTGGDTTFDYQLIGWDYLDNYTEEDGVPDVTTPGRFDYGRPPIFGTATGIPGPVDPEVIMMATIADLGGFLYSKPVGTMLIDYNGDPRGSATDSYQAYFFPGPVPAQIYMPLILK